jgi:uncharacterized protein YcnI
MKRLVIAVGALAAFLGVVAVGSAHVEPTVESAPAGSFILLGFQVPHGCDGSPTKSLSVAMPAGVVYAKPQPKAGWKLTTTKGKLPEAGTVFGSKVTTGVLSVTWSGGTLKDDQYDVFSVYLQIPNKVGKTIYFPAVQRCAKGVTRWIEIQQKGQAEPEHPAPAVKITKAVPGHMD